MSQSLKAELARFQTVVANRKSVAQVLELFDQLSASTKFTAAAKPLCYGHLIQECAKRIPDRHLGELQDAIAKHGAARLVHQSLMDEDAEEQLRPLIVRLLKATATDAQACYQVFLWAEESGYAPSRGHTLGMAIDGGMTHDEIDSICDLTRDLYYGDIAELCQRASAKKLAEQPA